MRMGSKYPTVPHCEYSEYPMLHDKETIGARGIAWNTTISPTYPKRSCCSAHADPNRANVRAARVCHRGRRNMQLYARFAAPGRRVGLALRP